MTYLKKPVRLRFGDFTTGDDATSFVPITMPHELLTISKNADKLSGVHMIRADIVLTLEINAARYQQGRYMLCWMPYAGAVPGGTISPWAPSPTTANYYKMHSYNRLITTQLPHVEIDIATQTSATLVIPFQSSQTHWLVNATVNTPFAGYAFIRPYSPLQAAAGDTLAGYTLWGALDNIELVGATIKTQSNMKVTRKKKGSPQEAEQSSNNIGPISSALSAVSGAAGALAVLPMLTPFMGPLSWASNILAGTAAAFGYSKPLNVMHSNRVTRVAIPQTINADTAYLGTNLGVISSNQVKIHNGASRTAVDEMSLDFIKGQYAYFRTVIWNDGATNGTLLAEFTATPYDKFQFNSNVVTFTPVAMLSRYFQYYRGGLKFRFKLVKTEFHSGRLAVSFIPYATHWLPAPPTIFDNTDYVERQIIDIRDTSEFEICIPYISPSPYQWCENTPVGYLHMHVVDRLICPDTVQNNIPILVEVCGSEDMEFAAPSSEKWEPIVPVSGILAQSNMVIMKQSNFKSIGCHDMGPQHNTVELAEACMGEKLTSVRQLVKRIVPNVLSVTSASPQVARVLPSPTTGQNNFFFLPYLNCVIAQPFTVGFFQRTLYRADPITFWSVMYAMQNGAIRVTLTNTDGANTTSTTTVVGPPVVATQTTNSPRRILSAGVRAIYSYAGKENGGYALGDITTRHGHSGVQFYNTDIDGSVTVQAPVYNRLLCRPTASHMVTPLVTDNTPISTAGANLTTVDFYVPSDNVTTAPTFTWHRSAADDFSLSCWLGTVPVISYTAIQQP